MPNDYMILAVIAAIVFGGGLFLLREAKRHNLRSLTARRKKTSRAPHQG